MQVGEGHDAVSRSRLAEAAAAAERETPRVPTAKEIKHIKKDLKKRFKYRVFTPDEICRMAAACVLDASRGISGRALYDRHRDLADGFTKIYGNLISGKLTVAKLRELLGEREVGGAANIRAPAFPKGPWLPPTQQTQTQTQ